MNEIVLIALIMLCLFTILMSYKIFDKIGLYFSMSILSLITFILSFKVGYIFKMNVNIGIIPFISVLTIDYIYSIKYKDKYIKDLIIVSTISNVILALLLVVLIYFIPSITETISINMEETFETNYKIIIAYPIIMTLSQIITIKISTFIRSVANNTFTPIVLTYIISAILYTIIFYIISYINVLSVKDSIFLGITSYIIGLIVELINIPFIIYITKSKKVKQ